MASLVTALNAITSTRTYTYVDTGYIGTDAIKVGLLYKTETVSATGTYSILNTSVDQYLHRHPESTCIGPNLHPACHRRKADCRSQPSQVQGQFL